MKRSSSSRRRAQEQSGAIGDEFKHARAIHGLSLQAAADRTGVSWSTAVRLEVGDPNARVGTLTAYAEAVGLDLVLRAYPSRPPGLRDTGQLDLVRILISRAHPAFKPTVELAAGQHGESVDLALFGPEEIICIEVERRIVDFQAQFRRADRKRNIVGMHRRNVRLVIAIEDTRRNRSAVEAHVGLIRAALPAGSREILSALARGQPFGRDGVLWLRRQRAAVLDRARDLHGRVPAGAVPAV